MSDSIVALSRVQHLCRLLPNTCSASSESGKNSGSGHEDFFNEKSEEEDVDNGTRSDNHADLHEPDVGAGQSM